MLRNVYFDISLLIFMFLVIISKSIYSKQSWDYILFWSSLTVLIMIQETMLIMQLILPNILLE